MSSIIILIVLLTIFCYETVSTVSQQKQFHKNLRKPNHRPSPHPALHPTILKLNLRTPSHHDQYQQYKKYQQHQIKIKNQNPHSHLRRKALAKEETMHELSTSQEPNINATHTIMVVLGCAIDYLQDDRITAALDYSEKLDQHVSWFLTGGIKNAIDNTQQTEAARMVVRIHSDQVVLDQTATNTAENFANLRKYVIEQYGHANLPQIVITTSAFHKNRAEKIFNGVFMQNDEIVIHPVWNLGQQACPTCWTDEHIHMRNVDNDVKNALNKYYTFAVKNILQ